MDIEWNAATSVGKVRKINQDAFFAESPHFAVADGLGGEPAGEVASALAISSFGKEIPHLNSLPEYLNAISRINKAIYTEGLENPSRQGMSTTFTTFSPLASPNGNALITNLGDSRAYLFRENNLFQITQDNSYVQDLVRSGQITPEEAEVHPEKNIVTKYLGVRTSFVPDTYSFTVEQGDLILLCSDGLTNELSDWEIEKIIESTGPSSHQLADTLVKAANSHGGRDNTTVVAIYITNP